MKDKGLENHLASIRAQNLVSATIENWEELKLAHDKVEVFKELCKKQDGYIAEVNPLSAQLARVRWHMGRVLGEMDKNRGEKGQFTGGNTVLPPAPPTYAQLGINKMFASRVQLIKAYIDADELEDILADSLEKNQEVTFRHLYDVALRRKREMEAQQRQKLKEQAAEMDLPDGQYRTIVIDPPWPMQKINREVRERQWDFDYPILKVDEIADLDVGGQAADGCHLYLWTTQKYLHNAFHVLEGWGFTYIFTMVWHKPGGFQPFGLPQYNCEFVLFGRRGGLGFLDTKAFPTCFNGKRREHSRKPDSFYNTVRRVSPGPRLDWFSREHRDGFEVWGVEDGKFNEK